MSDTLIFFLGFATGWTGMAIVVVLAVTAKRKAERAKRQEGGDDE